MESLLMLLCIRTNHVAHAAHGVNQLRVAGRIDLIAQQVHERVERVFFDFAVKSPDRFDQRAPRNHFAGAVHEPLQQIVFRARQRDTFFAAQHFAAGRIENEVGNS